MTNPDQQPLFEVITKEEYERGTTGAKRATNTEDRTLTGWYKLTHHYGFCTVPNHDEVYKTLHPEQQEYRQKYPTRMIFEIGRYFVCRDCFLAEADRDE